VTGWYPPVEVVEPVEIEGGNEVTLLDLTGWYSKTRLSGIIGERDCEDSREWEDVPLKGRELTEGEDVVVRCVVFAWRSNSYSHWEGVVDGVVGRNTAMDNDDIGISINTGFRVNAPNKALHPAP
jgi:hypothetical protein